MPPAAQYDQDARRPVFRTSTASRGPNAGTLPTNRAHLWLQRKTTQGIRFNGSRYLTLVRYVFRAEGPLIDLISEPPELSFETIASRQGMEYVAGARREQAPQGAKKQ